jgi:predicted nucleic acid-binding protein
VIVVDTNILAAHCLPGPLNEATESLLLVDPEWTAPLLWRSEFRNVLSGYLRRGAINLEQASEIMIAAGESLKGGEHAVADRAVLDLVMRSKCSAYDCEFVALAEALDVFFVTEDKQVLRAFPARTRSSAQVVKSGLK